MSALLAMGTVVIATAVLIVGDLVGAIGALAVGALALVTRVVHAGRLRTAGEGSAALEPSLQQREQHGWRALENELRRERRHGRSLTLVRVMPKGGLEAVEAAEVIRELLRTTDICFVADGSVYVAMPELCTEEAARAADRLHHELASRGCRCEMATATYPDDALTVNGLVVETSRRVGDRPSGTRPDQDLARPTDREGLMRG